MPADQAKVAAELRDILELEDEVSDEEILELTKGTLTRAQVEFRVASAELGHMIMEAWRPFFDCLSRKLR